MSSKLEQLRDYCADAGLEFRYVPGDPPRLVAGRFHTQPYADPGVDAGHLLHRLRLDRGEVLPMESA